MREKIKEKMNVFFEGQIWPLVRFFIIASLIFIAGMAAMIALTFLLYNFLLSIEHTAFFTFIIHFLTFSKYCGLIVVLVGFMNFVKAQIIEDADLVGRAMSIITLGVGVIYWSLIMNFGPMASKIFQ